MLLPFIILIGFGIRHWINTETAASRQSVASQAQALAHAIDRELSGYVDTAEVLAGSRHLQLGDLTVMEEIARDAAAKTGGNFVLIDRNSQQLFNTHAPPGTHLPISRKVAEIKKVIETRQPLIGNLETGTYSQHLQFNLWVPVIRDGQVRYVLSYVPDQSSIQNILAQTYRPVGWMATVIDGAGRIVARSTRAEEFFGTSASTKFMSNLSKPSGIIESTDLEGRASVTAFETSQLSDWHTVVWVPKRVLDAPLHRLFQLMLAMSSLALVLSLASAYVLTRLIDRPVGDLVAASKAIGSGDIVSIEPLAIREADVIGRALADASALIARRQRELRDSEASLRLALASAHAGAWEWSLSSDVLTGTPEFHRLFGADAAAPVLFKDWLSRSVASDEQERVSASIASAIEGAVDRFEIEFRTPDTRGAPARSILAFGHVERQGDAPSRVRGIAMDITERKRAEDHQRFLMRELSHRSKNLLTIVQAMASQTGRSSSTVSEFLQRFRRRLAALAGAQDALIAQNWFGASLAEVAKAQIETFIGGSDHRVTATGPDIFIDADAVQAIGLAMHELATNSVKYGALSSPAGRVAIDWRLEPADARQHLRLSWREQGGPPVVEPTRKGFGHAVIVQMVASKLDADVRLEFPSDGLHWTLLMPMKHLGTPPELLVEA
ncbi:MAG: hypothetical protein JSS20_16390 [Proteobacteria bacterium]|nr:hypothetical protein [Pseudomonadota bacterium]